MAVECNQGVALGPGPEAVGRPAKSTGRVRPVAPRNDHQCEPTEHGNVIQVLLWIQVITNSTVLLLEQDLEIPAFFKQALKANPKAWKYFQSLAPSYRRRYIRWIMHAKQA